MTTEILVSVAVGRGLSMDCWMASMVSVFSGCRLGSSRRMAGKALTSTAVSVSVCDIGTSFRSLTYLYYQQWLAGGQGNSGGRSQNSELRIQKCSEATSLGVGLGMASWAALTAMLTRSG